MGCISPAKQPRTIKKRDGDEPVSLYKKGGSIDYPAARMNGDVFVAAAKKYGLDDLNTSVLNKIVKRVNAGETVDEAAKNVANVKNDLEADEYKAGGAVGLYANIHAKQQRIAKGSGEKMRKPGAKVAPTADAFKQSAKTAKKA
jgi:hypothetical protein